MIDETRVIGLIYFYYCYYKKYNTKESEPSN